MPYWKKNLRSLKSQLENKSLPNRADILFRRAPIRRHADVFKGDPCYFRLSKLKEVDDLRRRIVHQSAMDSVRPEQATDAVEFLSEACNTVIRSVAYGYNIPMESGFMLPESDGNF